MKYTNVEDIQPILAFGGLINSATDTVGGIIDTADMDLGLSFVMSAPDYTTGDFQLRVFQSDDGTGFTNPEELIGEPELKGDPAKVNLTAGASNGDILGKIGVIPTKRFVRPTVTSSNTPVAVIGVIGIAKHEFMPPATN